MSHRSFALVDMVVEQPTRRALLSIDENQHRDESLGCEIARMTSVIQGIALSDNVRPLLWIRFNPDAYRVDGHLQRMPKKRRYEQLLQLLRDVPDVTGVVYMYYDVDSNNDLMLLQEEGYSKHFHSQYVTRWP